MHVGKINGCCALCELYELYLSVGWSFCQSFSVVGLSVGGSGLNKTLNC